VRVGVVGAEGGHTQWMHIPIKDGQDYIPRFGWVDRHTVWIETLSRDHQHQAIYFADDRTGDAHPVLELNDDKFFPEAYDVSVADGAIILTNWADGHNHIYLYAYNADHPDRTEKATLVRQLTHGDFDVAKIDRVDHNRKLIDYASNEGNPIEQQIGQVSFAGQSTQLTSSAGTHQASFAPAIGTFVDKFSTRINPPTLALCTVGHGCRGVARAGRLRPASAHSAALQSQGRLHALCQAAVARRGHFARQRPAHLESLWRPRPAGGGQQMGRQPALRRGARPARLRRSPC
jgi:dipeptidyl-peptidase-4